jgi:hypothetical protein
MQNMPATDRQILRSTFSAGQPNAFLHAADSHFRAAHELANLPEF